MPDLHLNSFKSGLLFSFAQYIAFLGIGMLLSCSTTKQVGSYSGKTLPASPAFKIPEAYPTVQAYVQARQQLVAQDSLRDFDGQVVLSAQEQQLNHKLIALRKQMTAYYDSLHFFPPAHYFYKSQQHIYTTRLFELLQKMPKGGIHHLHPTAGVSFRWMVQRAIQEPDCYVYWQQDTDLYIKGQIHFYRQNEVPPGFYPIQQLNDSIPHFEEQLHDLLTFDQSIGNDSVDIWHEFEHCFKRIGGFVSYQPVNQEMYSVLFDSLITDGIQHVEMRASLAGSLYDLKHAPGSFPADSIIKYIQEAATDARKRRDPNFTFKLIYTNLRFLPLPSIRQDLIKAFQIRAKYPDLVKAYDLVAKEDAGHPTSYFTEAWLMRDSLAKKYMIDMSLCLHDGESDWEHVSNIYDALLLKSMRIGHGFNLSFFPAAEEIVRNQNICIEVSPLSNQILGYVGDLRIHPAHAWIKRGIQISISSDDPAIFGYSGVTPDYWSIYLAWELDLRSLKKLSMNSIVYSLLNETEKQQALRVWEERWRSFVRYANNRL